MFFYNVREALNGQEIDLCLIEWNQYTDIDVTNQLMGMKKLLIQIDYEKEGCDV